MYIPLINETICSSRIACSFFQIALDSLFALLRASSVRVTFWLVLLSESSTQLSTSGIPQDPCILQNRKYFRLAYAILTYSVEIFKGHLDLK